MKGFTGVILVAGVAFGLPQPPLPPGGTGFIGNYQCAQDNCFRAVLATNVNPREQVRRKRECSLLLNTTVLGTPTSIVTQTCRATTYTETVQVTVYQPTTTSVKIGQTTTATSDYSPNARENNLAASGMAALTKHAPVLAKIVQNERDRGTHCSRCLAEQQQASSGDTLDKRQLLPTCTLCSTQPAFIVPQTSIQTVTQRAVGPNVTVILPTSTTQPTTTQQVPGISTSTRIPSVTVTTTFTTTHSYLTETHTSTVAPPSLGVPVPVPIPTIPIPLPTIPVPIPTISTPTIPIPTQTSGETSTVHVTTTQTVTPSPSSSPTTPTSSPSTITQTVTAPQTSTTKSFPVPTDTPSMPSNTPTPQPTPPPADKGDEFALLVIPGYATGLCAKPEDYVSACECYGVRPQVSTRPPLQAVSTYWIYNTITTTATFTIPGVPCRWKREVCVPFATETITLIRR
ncbi:hypothetical protein MCOR25_011173 [Pyricularia grisea]|uniref:Uncharacterized protein n=1 Tax=Pyricularia grisea TaxID=148305 RepID=A0A6P8BB87_PYRGI|nr:uncharacterized protein PgNI_02824 [Pyricularia grisea]KAI6342576.1 hypothetical protein MCOR25_011173 [Pyricularia grisea]TLD13106.1 hypothetical protein PgNI_02824 [Pyricularia grisea]